MSSPSSQKRRKELTGSKTDSMAAGVDERGIAIVPADAEDIKRDVFASAPSLKAVIVDTMCKASPEDCNFGEGDEEGHIITWQVGKQVKRYRHVPVFRIDTSHPPLISLPDTVFKTGYRIPVLMHSIKPQSVNVGGQTLTCSGGYCVGYVTFDAPRTFSVEGVGEVEVKMWSEAKNYGVADGSLRVPYGVRGVEDRQYAGNNTLTAVRIPATVKVVGDHAFDGCANLTRVEFMPGVREIWENAFSGTRIADLRITGSVTTIGRDAFNGAAVQTLTLAEGLEEIALGAFQGNDMHSVCIPSTVTAIGLNAFKSCTRLRTVAFGAGSRLAGIEYNPFCSTGLESIVIPRSVRSIGPSAFDSTPLSSITFEEGSALESVGAMAFNHTKLTAITFPPSVRSFGGAMFIGTPIARITAPGTAKFDKAFLECVFDDCTVCFYNCKKAPKVKHKRNITVETRRDGPPAE